MSPWTFRHFLVRLRSECVACLSLSWRSLMWAAAFIIRRITASRLSTFIVQCFIHRTTFLWNQKIGQAILLDLYNLILVAWWCDVTLITKPVAIKNRISAKKNSHGIDYSTKNKCFDDFLDIYLRTFFSPIPEILNVISIRSVRNFIWLDFMFKVIIYLPSLESFWSLLF